MKHRKCFRGRCIDGPCEGEWHENDDAYFVVARQRDRVVVTTLDVDLDIDVERYFYIWLHGYRAWAWAQPNKVGHNDDGR